MLEESVSSVPSIWSTVNSWFTPTVLFAFLNFMIATIALTSCLSKPNRHEKENPEPEQEIPQNLQRSPSVLQRLKSINFYSHRSPPTVTHYAGYSYSSAPLLEKEPENSDEKHKSLFARSPSIVLQRLKSFSLYSSNSSPEPPAPSPPTTDGNHHLQKPHDRGTRLSFEEACEKERAWEQEFGAGVGREEEELVGHERFEEQSSLDEIYSQLKGHQVGRTKPDTKQASGEVPTKLVKKMKESASAKSAFAHFEEDDNVERFRPASAREYKAKVSDDEEEGEEGEVDAKADDFINRFKQQLKLQRLDSIMRSRGHGK